MVPPSSSSRLLAGRYRLERRIGRGATSTVYLARDDTSGATVAAKLLRGELIESGAHRRFLREMRLTMELRHPSIVPVLDAGEDGNDLYIVMEFMGGGTLRDRLASQPQLALDDVVSLIRDVGGALAHAHRAGVIHRDVKPENILFRDGRAYLADFGIARAIEHVIGDTSTSGGVIRGTAAYMSPEQASGARDYDARSDMFSLGCVAYEAIAGVPAFIGPTPEAALAQRLLHPPRELKVYRPEVADDLAALVMKSLAIAVADRFRSMPQLLEALDAHVARNRSPGAAGTPAPPRARQRAAAAAGVLAAGALLVWSTLLRPSRPFDDALVAVAPFDVYDPRLSLWREGYVDVLSASFDGAGRFRTVSAAVASRKWVGPATRSAARALAERTGARYVVYGRLVPSGRDSIRATALVYDARRQTESDAIDLRDAFERPDRLADALALRLVSHLGESLDQRTGTGGLGTASLAALRAYLRGEYYLRRAQWDSAVGAYREAIRHDSSFALANWRMKTSLVWQAWDVDSIGDEFALRAGRLNHGLAPRESLLVTVDSLWASLSQDDDGQWSRMRRLARTLDEAVRRYPEDPWIWYKIGEARFHLPVGLDHPLSEHLAAFDRAIALDSGFALPYVSHAVELALILRGSESALAYTHAYRFTAMPGVQDSAAMLVERLLDPSLSRLAQTEETVRRASRDVLYRVATDIDMWFDPEETAVAVARAMLTPRRPGAVDRERCAVRLARVLAVRGHLDDAWRELSSSVRLSTPADEAVELFADLTAYGVVPASIADSLFDAWQRVSSRATLLALPWWAERRDTLDLVRASRRFTSAGQAAGRRIEAYGRRAAAAYLALARDDSAGAMQHLTQLTDSLCADCYRDWLTRARLNAAARHYAAARRDFERVMTYAWTSPIYVQAALELGRLLLTTGASPDARQAHAVVVRAWPMADERLRPFTAEAAGALARLGR